MSMALALTGARWTRGVKLADVVFDSEDRYASHAKTVTVAIIPHRVNRRDFVPSGRRVGASRVVGFGGPRTWFDIAVDMQGLLAVHYAAMDFHM